VGGRRAGRGRAEAPRGRHLQPAPLTPEPHAHPVRSRNRAGNERRVAQRKGPGICRPLWREGGLSDIETSTLELAMDFSAFDDYWQPFLAGATPTSRLVAAVDAETGGAIGRALAGRIARTWADRLTAR
jgi:hypothetical protein